ASSTSPASDARGMIEISPSPLMSSSLGVAWPTVPKNRATPAPPSTAIRAVGSQLGALMNGEPDGGLGRAGLGRRGLTGGRSGLLAGPRPVPPPGPRPGPAVRGPAILLTSTT